MTAPPLHRLLQGSGALAVVTVAASVLGMILNLVLAVLMSAGDYALYSLMLGLSQLLTSLCFEWARVNLIRFSHTADAAGDAERRATLVAIYGRVVGGLAVAALLLLALGALIPFATAAAIIIGVAVLQGIFDAQQAAARAAFDDVGLVVRMATRALSSLTGAVAACLLFRSGEATLIGFALGFLISSLPGLPAQLRRWRAVPPSSGSFRAMLRFGMPAAIGTNLSIAVPTAIRTAIVGSVGLADAGGVLLVLDLAQRLFATLGAAVNIVVMQNAVRAVEHGDAGRVAGALRQQVAILAIATLAAALLFVSVRSLAGSLVPAAFIGGFGLSGVYAVLAMGLLSLRQYALDPLFVVLGTSGMAPLGAGATLATLLLYGLATSGDWLQGSLADALLVLVAAAFLGALTSAAALAITRRLAPPTGTLARSWRAR